MYARRLSSLNLIPKSADSVTVEHVVEHAEFFLLRCQANPQDVLLYAFLLTGMNSGMRFDELSKIQLDNFKCTRYDASFSIEV